MQDRQRSPMIPDSDTKLAAARERRVRHLAIGTILVTLSACAALACDQLAGIGAPVLEPDGGTAGSSSGSGSGSTSGSSSSGSSSSGSGAGSGSGSSSGGDTSGSSSSGGSGPDDGGGGTDATAGTDASTATEGGSADATSTADASQTVDSGDSLAAARAQCVQIINNDRATLTPPAPPLTEYFTEESCADSQAQADYVANTPHSAFGQCNESAQAECAGFPGPPSSVMTNCLAQLWAEGPPAAGHDNDWLNMSNSQYTQVACGFYQTPTGDWWATQDFW